MLPDRSSAEYTELASFEFISIAVWAGKDRLAPALWEPRNGRNGSESQLVLMAVGEWLADDLVHLESVVTRRLAWPSARRPTRPCHRPATTAPNPCVTFGRAD